MALPQFQSWAPDPKKEPKENLSDLISWIVESQMRLHDHAMRQGALLTSIYNKVNAGQVNAVHSGAPPTPPPFGLGSIAQAAAMLAQNREAIKGLINLLTK